MSEAASPSQATPGPAGESGGGQVQERVREGAQQAAGQVQEKAQEVRGRAGGRAREEIDRRSTQAGEQVRSLADAVRRTGGQLREEGKERPARVADQAAERADRVGRYLEEADADRILRDVEDFGRRQPWAVAALGAAAGFLAARFLKASSRERYERALPSGPTTAPPRPGYQAYDELYGERMPSEPGAEVAPAPTVPGATPQATD